MIVGFIVYTAKLVDACYVLFDCVGSHCCVNKPSCTAYPQVPMSWGTPPLKKLNYYMVGDIRSFTAKDVAACRAECALADGKSNSGDSKVCKYFSWYPFAVVELGRCALSTGAKGEKRGLGWSYMALNAKPTKAPIGEYEIFTVAESTGGKLVLCAPGDEKCATTGTLKYTNPTVEFSAPDKEATQVYSGLIGSEVLTPLMPGRYPKYNPKIDSPDVFIMKSPRKDCQKNLYKGGSSFVGFATSKVDSTIKYYKYDPRLRLLDNTLDSPANIAPHRDAGVFGHSAAQAQCPLVIPNFLNEGKCVRHTEGTCSPLEFITDKVIKLDRENLRLWYTTSNKMVFAVDGLPPPTSSPCTPHQMSRWRLIKGTCKGGPSVDAETKQTLLGALQRYEKLCNTMFSRLPEEERSYSSVHGNPQLGTGSARSKIDSHGTWSPSKHQNGEWIQFNFGTVQKVAGVVLQGRGKVSDYVKKVKVQRSLNGKDWTDVGEYEGTHKKTPTKNTLFSAPVSAQYVRLVVTDFLKRIYLRADLILCRPGIGTNPNIRDVVVSDLMGGKCSTSKSTIGAMIQVTKSTCWENVHPDTLNVYDFSEVSARHCAKKSSISTPNWYKRNNINALAEAGSHVFTFRGTNEQWKAYKKRNTMISNNRYVILKYAGRLGDSVQFQDLDTNLQTLPMANALGVKSTGSTVAFDACGSRAEVQNNPLLGYKFHFAFGSCRDVLKFREYRFLDFPYGTIERGKEYVFTNVVLKAADQLRQRVAWALSQIVVFSEAVSRFHW